MTGGNRSGDIVNPSMLGVAPPSAHRLKGDKALTEALKLIREHVKEHHEDQQWHAKARAYAQILIQGRPMGLLTLEESMRQLVHQLVKQACETAGYTLPSRPARKKRTKK